MHYFIYVLCVWFYAQEKKKSSHLNNQVLPQTRNAFSTSDEDRENVGCLLVKMFLRVISALRGKGEQ